MLLVYPVAGATGKGAVRRFRSGQGSREPVACPEVQVSRAIQQDGDHYAARV